VPIAGPPSGSGGTTIISALNVTVPGAVAGENIAAGQAVALIDNAGALEFFLCGSTTLPLQFYGFATATVLAGDPLITTTGRGSVVTPVLEGGGSLTPDAPVYLAATVGSVTHTAPTGSGETVYRVGFAIDLVLIVVNTDYRVAIP